MRASRKRLGTFLSAWIALLAATTVSAQQPVKTAEGFRPEGLSAINARLRGAVDRKEIAGAVALLMRDGKVSVLEAVGQRDEGVPMTPVTIFRIASMTKPVTSVAALILIDEGKLALDDPVSKFIPEFKDARVVVPGSSEKGKLETKPAASVMTVRHLLTHTSGLTYRFFGGEVGNLYAKAGVSDGLTQSEGTNEDNVRKIASQPLLFSPGTNWNYSLSTDVLGRVVEVASGQSLDAFFRERIFTPLKMVDTGFFLPSEKVGRLATLYEVGADKVLRRVGEEPKTVGTLVYSASYQYKGPRSLFSGGAGLTSTVSDYGRFLQMMLNGGTLDGVRILKPETVRAMTSNQTAAFPLTLGQLPVDGFGFGFGVVTPAGKDKTSMSPGSFSWGGFFHTFAWADPEKKLVGVFMTQLYPSGGTTIQTDFVKATYKALAD